MGPIGVKAHLAPFLPDHALDQLLTKILKAMALYLRHHLASAGILCISYLYIALLGKKGVTDATKYAITNANYLANKN